jgi:outer membrane protein assembly factor BamB
MLSQFSKKQLVTVICMLLLMSTLVSIVFLQPASAESKTQSWPLLDVSPDPIGIGQKLTIIMFANPTFPGAAVTNDIRRHDYTLTITKPDGKNETMYWPVIQDTGNGQVASYTPDQVGTYSFVFSFPDQVYTWNDTSTMRQWTNTVFLGATSKTVKITVQDEPLPAPINSYPLPTEYWTRPIEGQNTDWWTIASNWLGSPYISGNTAHQLYQPDGTAPGSAHVMWTKPLSDAGVVGGSGLGTPGETFYQGLTYNPRFLNPIAMGGRLFFEMPYQNYGSNGGYAAVDLRTGEELWTFNTTGVGVPSFGYYYALDYENQHGVMPDGLLMVTSGFSTQTWQAIDPRTGQLTGLNVTNVPSGFAAVGPKGEILRYQIDLRNHWLAQWNSSRLLPLSGTNPAGWINSEIDASLPERYDWNVTLPSELPTSTAIRYALVGDIILGTTSFAGFSSFLTPDPYTMWAISLKPGHEGSLLWMKDYSAPPNNVTRRLTAIDPVNRVIMLRDKETSLQIGYNLDTGDLMWQTPPVEGASDLAYFDLGTVGLTPATAYGRLYNIGWDGVLYCWDTKDGTLLWSYGNGGTGNSTSTNLQSSWGRYPTFIYALADGKVYMMSSEHSPDTPMWKGALARCVNATDGTEIFTLDAFGGQLGRDGTVVADGFWVYYNYYDGQLYCIGKGPSATTVSVPNNVVNLGSSVLIQGTITDIAAGTNQNEQAARFPNGVPAVSDASQGLWMDYVYMQKPRPTDTTGVPIVLSVVDSNGNYREIGTTTSTDGFFTYNWKPDIEGLYTVYASFAGSESYWPSHAVTSFAVDPAPATPMPTEAPVQSVADMYFVPAVAGIIVSIFIVGIILALLMLRKRP